MVLACVVSRRCVREGVTTLCYIGGPCDMGTARVGNRVPWYQALVTGCCYERARGCCKVPRQPLARARRRLSGPLAHGGFQAFLRQALRVKVDVALRMLPACLVQYMSGVTAAISACENASKWTSGHILLACLGWRSRRMLLHIWVSAPSPVCSCGH